MKGIYLPDSVEKFILPRLKPVSQLVLYKLLSYSGMDYHGNIWPSVSLLAKLCRIKQKKTIRAALQELASWSLISWDSRFIENRQTTNKYKLQFDIFEEWDRRRGVKFKSKTQGTLERIENKLDSMATVQGKQLNGLIAWCNHYGYEIDFTKDSPDISHIDGWKQIAIRQEAHKRGLLLNFKTG